MRKRWIGTITGSSGTYPLLKIDDVVVMGEVTMTASALHLLLDRNIEINFLSYYGKFKGRLSPPFSKNALLRIAQYRAYEERLNEEVTHPIFGYKVKYRRCIELQVRLLAKFLTGEINVYPPFQVGRNEK